MPTCQTIVFRKNEKHLSDVLKEKVLKEQLAGLDPEGCWLYPSLTKEQRETALEKFRVGYGPVDKIEYGKAKRPEGQPAPEEEYTEKSREAGGFKTDKNRLLFTTDDYARYARNKAIPYVSMVFSFDVPRTKVCEGEVSRRGRMMKGKAVINARAHTQEAYLHRIGCCGRSGHNGVAITLLASGEDKERIDQLKRFGLQIQVWVEKERHSRRKWQQANQKKKKKKKRPCTLHTHTSTSTGAAGELPRGDRGFGLSQRRGAVKAITP